MLRVAERHVELDLARRESAKRFAAQDDPISQILAAILRTKGHIRPQVQPTTERSGTEVHTFCHRERSETNVLRLPEEDRDTSHLNGPIIWVHEGGIETYVSSYGVRYFQERNFVYYGLQDLWRTDR